MDGFLSWNRKNLFQLTIDRRYIGVWQIDFVDNRHNGEPLFVRQMHVRDGLRLDSLSCVDNKQGPFAGGQRARHFIGKIDMTRRIEKVQAVGLTGFCPVFHRHRMRFNRNAAFPFQIHRIEQLILSFALLDRAGAFQQSIGQSRFAMIDVRDDTKVARSLDSHEESHYGGALQAGQFVAALPRPSEIGIAPFAFARQASDATAIFSKKCSE